MVGEQFQLKLDDYVRFVDPKAYRLVRLDAHIREALTVNPVEYFITSGDAIQKTMALEKDLWTAAGLARRLYSKSRNKLQQKFQSDLWSVAGKCRVLLNKLKQVRGDATFLETDWADHKLYCIPKNPRNKVDEPIE